jgi:hypothetical protein
MIRGQGPRERFTERIDHLVFAAPRLETGMDLIADRLGVRPVRGGRHPAWGSHNALVSLGPRTYLEIIAPDPELPRPGRGVIFGMETLREPGLVTWALRDEALERTAAVPGPGLGPVQSGRRARPDGTVLAWRLTDPYAMPLDGAVPFLISWGSSPHPAGTAPRAGDLLGLRIEHPDPNRVRTSLAALGLEPNAVDVQRSPTLRLVARIRTASGEVDFT